MRTLSGSIACRGVITDAVPHSSRCRAGSTLTLQATPSGKREGCAAVSSDGGSGFVPPANLLPLGGDGGSDDKGGTPVWSWKLLFAGLVVASAAPSPAHAIGRRKKKGRGDARNLDQLLDMSWPILKNLGFSGLLGVVAALAFKTVGRSLAIAVGALFTIVQLGAYFGYLKVDWARVHKDVARSFDINHDGKVNRKDFNASTAKLMAILSQGVPSVGGFCGGFSVGLSL